jgi:hypothetical protein
LIESIWQFLASQNKVAYLGSIANKSATWLEFQADDYNDFIGQTNKDRNLRRKLRFFLCDRLFDWLLQRLEFLGNQSEWNYSDAFIIGDSAVNNFMYKSQADIQAGICQFTNLPSIVNNVWFGTSLHNPCLQIADWISFSIRTWAEKRQSANLHLKMLLPHFRGFPHVLGWGIVPIPRAESFPRLPV